MNPGWLFFNNFLPSNIGGDVVRIADTATAAGLAIAIPVIAIPKSVGHLLAPLRALNRPWVTERAQKFEDAVFRFRAAPSALAGAFGGALVVQITIVAFYLLTAQGLVRTPRF